MAVCAAPSSSSIATLTPRVKATRLSVDMTVAGNAGAGQLERNGSGRALKEESANGPATARSAASEDTAVSKITASTDGVSVRTSLDGISDSDGRMTPVPRVDSTIRRSIPQTPRSTNGNPSQLPLPASASSSGPHPPLGPPMITLAPATVGLGTLPGEDQLKISLQSKDRIFVVMLSNEIEAFIQRVIHGETPNDAQVQAAASKVGSASLMVFGSSPTVRIQSQSASKFQRMLVYKAAEWYGIKAVSGPDAVMYIGVQGTLPEKSASLHLATLVPERETVQQKFQIMQRSQAGMSRSPASAEGSQGGPSNRKTLEQREAEYAAERERIYGSGQSIEALASGLDGGSATIASQPQDDDIDPVSRYAYGTAAAAVYEPVYASIYHPPASDVPSAPNNHPQMAIQGGYYVNSAVPYQAYQMMPYPANGAGYSTIAPGPTMYTPQQGYDQTGAPIMLVPQHANAYTGSTWHPQMQVGQPGMVPQPAMQSMHQPGQAVGNGWVYSSHPIQPGGVQPMMPLPNGSMPGPIPPPTPYGYPSYPTLMHPQPHRPQLQSQQHSSASSSISSHSYQSFSRPHSRGSTTSTRSAASSVRFGPMYPAQQYRQKGIKGVNGLTSLGVGQEKRNPRGQSPSSTTTTSSRSSRRTNSIALQAPSQHPLPQRPDWAAKNIPYEPSALPPPPQSAGGILSQHSTPAVGSPSASSGGFDQPYLSGLGMERQVSTLPLSYTNGSPGQQSAFEAAIPPITDPTATYPVGSSSAQADQVPHGSPIASTASFHRPEGVSGSPMSALARSEHSGTAAVTSPLPLPTAPSLLPTDGAAMSPEDLIEAKLQALSVSTGVSIGPPPVRSAGGPPPSYAKIVRRD